MPNVDDIDLRQLQQYRQLEKDFPAAFVILRRRTPSLLVSIDVPYFLRIYNIIRSEEKKMGNWTKELEDAYKNAIYLKEYYDAREKGKELGQIP